MTNKISLYIHIPFCKQKCPYCDFYSVVPLENKAKDYIDVLVGQINRLENKFSTIYVGGGTPTVLEESSLTKLLKSLSGFVGEQTEFSFEANPESINEDKLKILKSYGVNRLSIGVQSLNDEKLVKLGRIHDAARAISSVYLAKDCGFDNIGVDLIYGVWGETYKCWADELRKTVKLPIRHISCYSLSYESGTKICAEKNANKIAPLDEAGVADMYKLAVSFLPKHKFKHYEISNFARGSFFCRHNLNYWDNSSYIGLGPSAVTYQLGIREKNFGDLDEYTGRAIRNLPIYESKEKLSKLGRAKETAALKIRTKEGIDFFWFKQNTGFDFIKLEAGVLNKLIKDGLIRYKRKNNKAYGINLTQKGILFCDIVSANFL
jgi:oxygen-independent coproporphyrinogen-3 oxidase